MNLELAEYQKLTRETFHSFFRRESTPDRVRASEKTGFDPDLWEKLGKMGGLTLSLPEGAGGDGAALVDAVLVGMEAGRRLAAVPYADAVAALRLLAAMSPTGPDEIRHNLCVVAAPDTVTATIAGGTITGSIDWSRAGAAARYVLVPVDGRLALIDLDGARVERSPLPNLGRFPMATLTFTGATPLEIYPIDRAALERWQHEWRVLAAAELVGAGREAFALAQRYVLERTQFGQLIGAFQAIQHRLADCHTALDAAELLVLRAAAYETAGEDLGYFSALALLAAADAAERGAKESLQFHGGYGFMLEYDVHLYLRWVKALRVMACGPDTFRDAIPPARAEGRSPIPVEAPDGVFFRRRPQQEALFREVASLVEEHLSEDAAQRVRSTGTIHDPDFHRAMAARGWVGATWPQEVGGAAMSPMEAGVLWEALHHAGAPVDAQQLTELAGYVLVKLGTPRQREEILPKIIAGDLLIALGYTEPDSGSDVAAARTRAQPADGGYVINGSKMFTTMAHISDYVLLLARTDPEVPKHRGLSMFLVPLDSPGIEIQPIETFGGERTNATFYDNVFVPDWLRVGDENRGWEVLALALDVERATIGGYVGQARRAYDDLRGALAEAGRQIGAGSDLERRLALLNTGIEAGAALADRVHCLVADGRVPGVEAAMTKLLVTEVFKDLAHQALDLIGPRSLLTRDAPRALGGGELEHAFRHSQISTIYGGSNEIQRNIVAQRGLGLPR